MNIPHPKYEIGHIFWVPRCKIERNHITKTIDSVEYTRIEKVYIPYVKAKEVRSIYIVIDYRRRITIEYNCIDHDRPLTTFINDAGFNLPMRFFENDIENYTEEEAMIEANEYADNCKEYYGSTLHNSPDDE